MIISPLEGNPKILEKIGLFIVLFNLIDTRLSTEFHFVINQNDDKKRPILNFLISQEFQNKLDILKLILGDVLYQKINQTDKFRNFIAHSAYGVREGSLEEVHLSKIKRGTGKYHSIPITETSLDEKIKEEREILESLHQLILDRLPKNKQDKSA